MPLATACCRMFALTGLLESYIMMRYMDGFETMRRLRADPRFTDVPVIALTAKAMLEDRSKCLAAGASDYASKPVDTGQLLSQLCTWLSN